MTARASAALLLLAVLAASPSRAENAGTTLFMTPFSFFDTSGEPRDQNADHAARLATMTRELAAALQTKGLYRIESPAAGTPPCPAGDSDCILKQARAAGADLVLAGAVQKVSTMASDIWVGAFETAAGKRVFYRQLTFRGDTDEAWHHATVFLAREIEDDPPKVH